MFYHKKSTMKVWAPLVRYIFFRKEYFCYYKRLKNQEVFKINRLLFLQSDSGISTSSLIRIGPNLCRKVDTYGITNIKTYGLILIRLSQAPEFKFHSVSYTLISSKLFLVHAYSYRQGVNMKEIKDILFLICSQSTSKQMCHVHTCTLSLAVNRYLVRKIYLTFHSLNNWQ